MHATDFKVWLVDYPYIVFYFKSIIGSFKAQLVETYISIVKIESIFFTFCYIESTVIVPTIK